MLRTTIALTLLAASACAMDADEPDTDTTTDEIVGGSATTQWPAVGWLYGHGERCSGTLIAPNVMLTAAHCTDNGLPIHVGFGAYRTGTETDVTRIYRSPSYANASDGSHDVAVLILAVPQWTATIPISGAEYPGVTPPGRELRLIGYGDNTSGLNNPDPTPTAPRKTAHLHVDYAERYSIGTTGINGAGCFGDSGGPLMDLNGTKIYGVSSRVFTPCTSTTRNRFAAVAYEPFIAQAIYDNPPLAGGWASPLWRYYSPSFSDHFFTYSRDDVGAAALGYHLEGITAHLFTVPIPGTIPMFRYWNPTTRDHFYTQYWGELGAGANGYTYERVEGYIFPRSYAGTAPLYRYWSQSGTDHFYTTERNDFGYAIYGYTYENVVGYVYP